MSSHPSEMVFPEGEFCGNIWGEVSGCCRVSAESGEKMLCRDFIRLRKMSRRRHDETQPDPPWCRPGLPCACRMLLPALGKRPWPILPSHGGRRFGRPTPPRTVRSYSPGISQDWPSLTTLWPTRTPTRGIRPGRPTATCTAAGPTARSARSPAIRAGATGADRKRQDYRRRPSVPDDHVPRF